MKQSLTLWIIWAIATLCGGAILLGGMLYGGASRAALLIGETTSGHHQIELACTACHTTAFGGSAEIEKTCKGCHAEELKKTKDSHPIKKFKDPRNADRLEKLAANKCITCHTEHKPRVTNPMGVTLPTDYCALCHQDVGKNRPSHKGLAYTTCASAGCHNYHDNSALYEDFLEKHANAKWITAEPVTKQRTEDIEIEAAGPALTTLAAANAPDRLLTDPDNTSLKDDWLASSHAKAGVNCAGCHAPDKKKQEDIAAAWVDKPAHTECATCHAPEAQTWRLGKHGMRLADKMNEETAGFYGFFKTKPLSPMRPEMARIPMHEKVAHNDLTCANCHGAHKFETVKAQVEACATCHADEHTKAYFRSAHYELWKNELKGDLPKGSGVTCASCHMPRQWVEGEYDDVLITNHNQNANLRPNEKMIRSVCMDCHGLGFSIDSLAEEKLVQENFLGRPSTHIESIDWVLKRAKERELKKKGTPAEDQ